MIQDFNTESEEFRGQRWLTTLLLLVFAAAMVVVGIKGLASGEFFEATRPAPVAGIIPARLAIPGQNFEVALAEISSTKAGQPVGVGWLNTSARPGEAGTAVIAVDRDWPVANLQPGDRLEIIGRSGEKLTFEITANTASTLSLASAGQGAPAKELKLVTVEPDGQPSGQPSGRESRVISARPVATN